MLARRRELVDSATQTMVADEFCDDRPWVDLSEEELMKGFVGVDMQQTTSDEDASEPVDSGVLMHKHALRKYLADDGITEVVRPDGR